MSARVKGEACLACVSRQQQREGAAVCYRLAAMPNKEQHSGVLSAQLSQPCLSLCMQPGLPLAHLHNATTDARDHKQAFKQLAYTLPPEQFPSHRNDAAPKKQHNVPTRCVCKPPRSRQSCRVTNANLLPHKQQQSCVHQGDTDVIKGTAATNMTPQCQSPASHLPWHGSIEALSALLLRSLVDSCKS